MTSPMRIKPTIAYEYLLIYYIIIVLNLQHVTDTYCGHIQGSVLKSLYVLCVVSLLSQVSLSQKLYLYFIF